MQRLSLAADFRAATAGPPCDSTADLDDTPDLCLYARSAAAGQALGTEDPAAATPERLGPDRVVSALARLAEDLGLTCGYNCLADPTYEEIARVLGYPVGTVRARLHRGRRLLQKSLRQVAQDEEIVLEDREATT